ncbi:MAG: hypothetical protein IJT94_03120 [Oscillibacter sp.]|nr:hypothetical protein [Oscillibacter sp.]
MKDSVAIQKLQSQSGVTWVVTVLAAACVIMSIIVVGEPLFAAIRDRMAAYSCSVAVNKAQNMINMESLQSGTGGITLEQAKSILNKSKWAMDTLCPGGGECRLVAEGNADDPDERTRYTVVCGLHDENLQRRTRVNAEAALEKVETEIEHRRLIASDDINSVTISLNGEELRATRQDVEMTRSLYYSSGYSGNVVFYEVDEEGVTFLAFGDEYYCANWRRDWGWDGTAYPDPA